MKFVKPNHPILTKLAKTLTPDKINSPKIKQVIEQMLKIAHGEQKDGNKPIMVGLAAPQIGILKRIILVDIKADGKGGIGNLRVFINPEITWASKKEGEWYEGCFSIGRVCGIVSRSTSIKVKAYTLKTKFPHRKGEYELKEEKFKGYVSRIFQHEIDHLNGIRFPDLISDPNKLHWVLKKEFSIYRNKQAWKNWPNKYSFEKWKRIKH